jgi:RNA polymerase sigma-70 factor, ECF subfamily
MPTLEATRDARDRTAAREPLSDAATLEPRLEQYRRELTAYCRRVLGSAFEAEDAVQETLVRAWRGVDRFEGRATLRSWLYRIATNVCSDMMRRPQRRARPMDLGPSTVDVAQLGTAPLGATIPPAARDPADMAASRETILLALSMLQQLPPRQRAVLILREVLRWKAEEVAELLGSTVASVNSALQRARGALAAVGVTAADACDAVDVARRRHLAACVDAFGQVDVESLMALLHDDATACRPADRRVMESTPVQEGPAANRPGDRR